MTKLNSTQIATIKSAVKSGFTYAGDSFFKSFQAGKAAVSSLVSAGYLNKVETAHGTQYEPTEAARDFVTYGITI